MLMSVLPFQEHHPKIAQDALTPMEMDIQTQTAIGRLPTELMLSLTKSHNGLTKRVMDTEIIR